MPVQQQAMTDVLAQLALFSDLTRAQLEMSAHTFQEVFFQQGQRVLRRGFSDPNFYVIIDGEAVVSIDGAERGRLGRGDFFGEVSVLLGDPAIADVAAAGPLRCISLPGAEMQEFLHMHPAVMLRILKAQASRLRAANEWRP